MNSTFSAILLAGIAASTLSAGTEFGPVQLFYQNPLSDPDFVEAVDIDGDGDLDLVSKSGAYLADTIVWLENTDGEGTFSYPRYIQQDTHETNHMTIADVDLDGDPDVVAGSVGFDRKIFWFRNEGDGQFSERLIVATGQNTITPPCVVDWDDDGDHDLVWYDNRADRISWAENKDGKGDFGGRQDVLTGLDNAKSVLCTDLDRDGDPDLAIAFSQNDRLAWFENLDGEGELSVEQAIAPIDNAAQLIAADLNGDSAPELILSWSDHSRADPGTVSVFFNQDGQGSFGTAQTLDSRFSFAPTLGAFPIDGDDHLDLLVTDAFENKVSWLRNDGQGTFAAPATISTPDVPRAAVAADLDNDGDPDIATVSGTVELAWIEKTGSGYGRPTILTGGVGWLSTLEATDLTGDDLPEVFIGSSNTSLFWKFSNLGNGQFGPPASVEEEADHLSLIRGTDLDGDGDQDLICAYMEGDLVAWHENDGTGSLAERKTINALGFHPSDLAIGDLNNDNQPDVAISYASDSLCLWHPATNAPTGFGNFDILSGSIDRPQTITLGDFDGDGDNDLVSAHWSSSVVQLYPNEPTGTMGAPQPIADLETGLSILRSADIDNDGDLDLVAGTDAAGSTLQWLENDGSGTFATIHSITPSPDGLEMIELADLDLDGDIDVLTAAQRDKQVRWYENKGDGTFAAPETIIAEGQSLHMVIARDLDGDGDLDILAGEKIQGRVYWVENTLGEDALSQWSSSHGLSREESDPHSDTDGDGATLLEEFAHNLDPTVRDRVHLPTTADGVAGLPRFWYEVRGFSFFRRTWINVEFIRRKGTDTGLEYEFQGSADFKNWQTLRDGSPTVTPIDDTWERVVMDASVGNPSKHFGRLRIHFSAP